MSCTGCNKNSSLSSTFKLAQKVATGLVNYVTNDPIIETMATERLAICGTCPFAKELVKVNKISIVQCTDCTCLVELKSRVPDEHCGQNKW